MSTSLHVDAFHAHEVLHLSGILAELFETQIGQHPFTRSDPDLAAAADRLTFALADFYQRVGEASASRFPDAGASPGRFTVR